MLNLVSPILTLRGKAVDALRQGVEHCPPLEDARLRELDYQVAVREAIRHGSGSAFDELADGLEQGLSQPPFFVCIRGCDCDETGTLLVALSSVLGEIVEPCRQPWAKVVRSIRPQADRVASSHPLNERLHTDGTDWPRPNDFTCLLCVRPDQRGDGRSRLLTAEAIGEELTARGCGDLLAALLATPVPWRLADEMGGGFVLSPVLSREPLRIRWMRYTIELAVQEGLAALEVGMDRLLQQFEQAVETARATVDLALERGDLLIVDNVRCLHARTPVRWPADSERLLLRTKVHRSPSQPRSIS